MQNQVKRQRDYRYEFVRIIAIMLVIATHTYCIIRQDGSALRDFNIKLITVLSISCDGVFFLMSGKFALQKTVEDNKLGDFYFKKIVYLILPLLIYMLFYTGYELRTTTGSLHGFFHSALINITNKYYNGYHFWFMYSLVGCILVAPFLARILVGISKKSAIVLFAICLIYNTIFAYTPYFTSQILAWGFPFATWTTYFLIGGCFNTIFDNKKMEIGLYILGAIGFVILMLKQYFSDYKMFMFDNMPTYTFFSMAVYLLLQKFKTAKEKLQKVILFLGKRTYGIYLIHFMAIWYIGPKVVAYYDKMPALVFWIFLMIVVYIGSLVSSYLIDLIVINNIQKLCKEVRKRLSRDTVEA